MKNLNLKNTLLISCLAIGSSSIFTSCSKGGSGNVNPTNTSPTITALSVNTGPYNTAVTISGTNFSSTKVNDKVAFNGVVATVTDATSTQLKVTVPIGAGTGAVTLSINGNTATGPTFTYQYTPVVSTFAGSGQAGSANGLGAAASFNSPVSLAIDAAGNIYVADSGNNLIRKITSTGAVSTLAGNGVAGFADGKGTAASFNGPYGVAVDASGNVYVADLFNEKIRKITPDGTVSTLAGNGKRGETDGKGSTASFLDPDCLAVDATGNIYVGDEYDIRKITSDGTVSTLAGSTKLGNANGVGNQASFYIIQGITIDAAGNIYAADSGNDIIRKVSSDGVVTTYAGSGSPDYIDAVGTSAAFVAPSGVALDANGNLYVADSGNNLVREITKTTRIVSTLAGTTAVGHVNGIGSIATFNNPVGIVVDANNNIYVENDDNLIRKISMQ